MIFNANSSRDGSTNLTAAYPYDALSYTWGSPEKADRITVNGSTMHVTFNLYTALQHLRFRDEDRILWIDAICINQDNKQEKNHQVQQMSYIYKEAVQVVIWLGHGTTESDFIVDFMKQLHENSLRVEGDWRPLALFWMYPRSVIQPGLNSRLREGMESILRRPWFRRIWILQEIANARVAIVLCGTKSVSARTFAQFPSLIGLQPQPHCQAVLDIMPGLSREESWWSRTRNFHTLLVKFRESEATDKRDIIYALLAISSDAYKSDLLLPNYEKSLQQVIRDTTSFLLSHTKQDDSLYNFLDWTLAEFLQCLDSLSNAVLESASESGHEAVVKLLLDTSKVDADSKDMNGWTPLSWAVENGHEAVVKVLLDTGKVDADSKDMNGRTPLSRAAANGNEAVVKLLLDTGKVDANSMDMTGWTPPSWAAGNGHEAVVKLLLEQGAELELKDSRGQTPL